jgi:hypothetical protein
MADGLLNQLNAMKANWKTASKEKERMFGAEDLPDDGTYRVQLVKLHLEADPNGKLRVPRQFTILDGDHSGVGLRDNMYIEHQVSAAFFQRYIEQHGIQAPENPKDIPEVLEHISGLKPIYEIRARRNDNGYFEIKVLSVEDTGEAGEGGEATPAEDGATPPEEGSDELKTALLTFCSAQGITDATDEDDVDALKERIRGFNYKFAELSAEDVKLLEDNDLGTEIIERPAPKKATPKPTAKPAPLPAKKPGVIKKK